MKSSKQRRKEIQAKRASRVQKVLDEEKREARIKREKELQGKTAVNTGLLAPSNSYSTPDYVERGYYIDELFNCKDCGKEEIWTATQQKWWYEVARGDIWTTAIRCRSCRRKERTRVAEARRVHKEGLERKHNKSSNTDGSDAGTD